MEERLSSKALKRSVKSHFKSIHLLIDIWINIIKMWNLSEISHFWLLLCWRKAQSLIDWWWWTRKQDEILSYLFKWKIKRNGKWLIMLLKLPIHFRTLRNLSKFFLNVVFLCTMPGYPEARTHSPHPIKKSHLRKLFIRNNKKFIYFLKNHQNSGFALNRAH